MTTSGPALIGLDVGTTAVKAGLYDTAGAELALCTRTYPLHTPGPDRAEQDPDQIAGAAIDAIAEIGAAARGARIEVAGLGLSTAMHGLIGLDSRGRALTPLVTYADTRARAQAAALRSDHFDVYRRTGTPLHPMAPLAKLWWFHEEQPDVASRARHWVTAKEHLVATLTGALVIDESSASGTGLYGLADRTWDDGALTLARVDVGQLAPIVTTDHIIGGLTGAVAERVGLPAATRVVVGAADGALANVGVGALGGGTGAVTIGTSGAVRIVTPEPVTDERMRLFCYVLAADRWVVGGAISNAGLWLRWLRDIIGGDLSDDALSALAAAVGPGSDGVTVLPYLTGERAPQWSTAPAGVMFGLRLGHGRGHLVRAGMEGVGHQLRLVRDALYECGLPLDGLRASGGFTRSNVWSGIIADVLGLPLEVPATAEATAFGAAGLAMVALGLLDDLPAVGHLVSVSATHTPDGDHRATHDTAHERYAELVDVLAGPFERLAAARDAAAG